MTRPLIATWTIVTSGRALTPRFVFEFDPQSVIAAIGAARDDVTDAADKVLFDVAQDVRSYVRKGIFGGKFDLAPLSPDWAAFKKRRELDPRILVASRKYAESIDVTPLFGGGGYFVRPDPNKIHPGYPGRPNKRQYTMEQIGRLAEYGYSYTRTDGKVVRVPPRPHWRPTADHFRALGPKIRQDIMDRAKIEMASRLRAAKSAAQKAARKRKRGQ